MRCRFLLGALLFTTSLAAAETNQDFVLANERTFVAEDPMDIIGGTRTTVGQYPTVVAVTAGGGICTGTIVAAEWILTAAHCISPSVLGLPSQAAVTSSVRVYYNTIDINTSA